MADILHLEFLHFIKASSWEETKPAASTQRKNKLKTNFPPPDWQTQHDTSAQVSQMESDSGDLQQQSSQLGESSIKSTNQVSSPAMLVCENPAIQQLQWNCWLS